MLRKTIYDIWVEHCEKHGLNHEANLAERLVFYESCFALINQLGQESMIPDKEDETFADSLTYKYLECQVFIENEKTNLN